MPDIYKQASLEEVVLSGFAIIVIIVLLGCLYSFFRAVFLFVFAGSKDENKKKGRNAIRFMVLGLLLTIAMLFVFPYTLKIMNIEMSDDYSPKQVFVRAGELIQKAMGLKDIIQESQRDNQFRGNMYYDLGPSSDAEPTSNYDL